MNLINPYRFAGGGSPVEVFYDTFENWAASDIPDGWSKGGTHDANNYVAENANGMRFYETDGNISIRSPEIDYVGSLIRITVDVYSVTTGSIIIADWGDNIMTITTPGVHTEDWTLLHDELDIKRGSDPDMVIRSIKVETLD